MPFLGLTFVAKHQIVFDATVSNSEHVDLTAGEPLLAGDTFIFFDLPFLVAVERVDKGGTVHLIHPLGDFLSDNLDNLFSALLINVAVDAFGFGA
jgi:hypothetical protein